MPDHDASPGTPDPTDALLETVWNARCLTGTGQLDDARRLIRAMPEDLRPLERIVAGAFGHLAVARREVPDRAWEARGRTGYPSGWASYRLGNREDYLDELGIAAANNGDLPIPALVLRDPA